MYICSVIKNDYLRFKFKYFISSNAFSLRFGVKCSTHQISCFPAALTACVYDVKCMESTVCNLIYPKSRHKMCYMSTRGYIPAEITET